MVGKKLEVVMNLLDSVMIMLSQGVVGVVVAGIAIVLMIIALVTQESWIMVAAALFTLPFTYVLGAWTGILLAVRLLPLLQLVSAYALGKREMMLAVIFPLLPFIVVLTSLVKSVIAQF